jgi:hypothetical protein
MARNPISTPRKLFRRGLYALLLLSFLFCGAMVAIRVTPELRWGIAKNETYRNYIFHYDVLQHRTLAFFEDQHGQHVIAVALCNKGLFSKIYSDAGILMLKNLAQDGYIPSRQLYIKITGDSSTATI